ncbi:MAG: NUDIX domain-containing protein [Sandaracinaceae bacterium]|nr:NUDIX domain-containing protein [Sandaracinaceae bacterium]
MSARVAEVDDQNRFVRWVSRAECHDARLPHRSVQVVLYDSAGRVVLQRRHQDKRTWPGAWDVAASGHVEEPDYPDPTRPDDDLDAVYDAVARRELAEELGVEAALERLGAFAPEPGVHYEHFVLYRGAHDGPYVPQSEEVAEVRAFDPVALAALLASDAPRTRSLEWLLDWLRAR